MFVIGFLSGGLIAFVFMTCMACLSINKSDANGDDLDPDKIERAYEEYISRIDKEI